LFCRGGCRVPVNTKKRSKRKEGVSPTTSTTYNKKNAQPSSIKGSHSAWGVKPLGGKDQKKRFKEEHNLVINPGRGGHPLLPLRGRGKKNRKRFNLKRRGEIRRGGRQKRMKREGTSC